MTDKEYWQAIYEAAKAHDRDNADIFTENPYKRASDADKLKADIDRLNTIVERLEKENACLLKACEEQFTFDTTEGNKYSVFNTVRKEFAEKLKQKARGLTLEGNKGAGFYIGNILLTNDIDELLKEYKE